MHTHEQPSPQQYVAAIADYRKQKDEFFAASPESPIPPELQGAGFAGLRYYPPDLAYRTEADLIPFDTPEIVMLGSTKGDIRRQLRYGKLSFNVMGEQCELLAFKDADDPDGTELFIPFKDSTSGGETYGAGRYVEIEDDAAQPGPHKVTLDFNLAYSPWCAYNVAYSCTLPPPENTLHVPIIAGELLFPVDH